MNEMKTLNALKLRIMVRAFRIRISNGESFEDIAADYPALNTDDLAAINAELLRLGCAVWPALDGRSRSTEANFKNFILMPEVTRV